MAKNLTEDAVRDLARDILGLVDSDAARAGVGQLTTFNQLGFAGVADKPDGWYLPKNKADVALVLETKATRIALGKAQVDEVLKNVRIVQTQYEKVIGVLYNGEDQGRGGSQDARQVAARRLLPVALHRRQHRQRAHLPADGAYQQLPALRVRHQEPVSPHDFHGMRVGCRAIRCRIKASEKPWL